MNNNTPDEELMRRVQEDKLDFAAVLFERYQQKIYNYFLRLRLGEEQSLDLAQTTFHRMLKYRKSFDAERSFKTWLYRIAHNVFVAHVEKQNVYFETIDNENLLSVSDEKEQERNENIELLSFAMQQLSETERELIVMHRIHEIKQSEISQILGISLSAVKVRVHRAMQKLKKQYLNLYKAEIYN